MTARAPEGGADLSALPAFITFTGLDEWADLERVHDLSRRYPLEWGVLFSPKRQGVEPRYPSLFHVGRITHRLDGLEKLAAHLCGDHARAVLAKARCTALTSWIDCHFARFQINTSDPNASARMVDEFSEAHGGVGILQCRASFPTSCRVHWLFDRSGGRGETPGAWPEPPQEGPFVGYAGGLGPDTVTAALARIAPGHDASRGYWIDMESAIRTDDRLDLDKCEAVCRAVYGDGQRFDPRRLGRSRLAAPGTGDAPGGAGRAGA